jgi:hypothetical protein
VVATNTPRSFGRGVVARGLETLASLAPSIRPYRSWALTRFKKSVTPRRFPSGALGSAVGRNAAMGCDGRASCHKPSPFFSSGRVL